MVDELLDRIDFTAAELRHPVDLLTVERVARRAGVPVTSLDSAIQSADCLRLEILAESIRSLDCEPGNQTWAALRQSIASVRSGDSRESGDGGVITPLIAARGQELAEDPAFPLLLSGFDRLDSLEHQLLARRMLRSVFEAFWPFISTACSGSPLDCPEEPTPQIENRVTLLLTADAYRRLLGASALDDEGEFVLSSVLASVIAAAFAVDPMSDEIDPLVTPPLVEIERPVTNPLTDAAIRAGAQILLGHEVPFTTSISVAEARRRTGLSNTAFYKTFGSLPALDQHILERAHRDIAGGFADDFFDQVLADIRAGDFDGGIERLAAHNTEHQRVHVSEGRPGHQLTPWLGYDDVGSVVSEAYAKKFIERGGKFYADFIETLGCALRPGLDRRSVAGTLNAVSVVSDYFIRIAPDREQALAWAGRRLPALNAHFLA